MQAGADEERPRLVRTIVPDKVSALTAAQAITAALLARERSGEGQHVKLAMLDAIVVAPLGDDVMGEDPTVNRLEALAAERLGKEAALFVPSGTMANQIAIKTWTHLGDELICERNCHVFNYARAAIAAWNAANPVLKKGIALTPVKFGISFTLTHLNQAGALVHVYQDGSIHMNHGGTEMGQGLNTKVAQVVADAFQVDIDLVKVPGAFEIPMVALRMANIEHAKYVFIFANLRFADPDVKTMHIASRVVTLNPTAMVFVPTTPNPTTGFLQIVPASHVVPTDFTVEEAFQMIMSLGVLSPSRLGNLA